VDLNTHYKDIAKESSQNGDESSEDEESGDSDGEDEEDDITYDDIADIKLLQAQILASNCVSTDSDYILQAYKCFEEAFGKNL